MHHFAHLSSPRYLQRNSEVVHIKFWSLMLTYYSVCRYDIIKSFMNNTVRNNRAVLKRLFLEVWELHFVKALYQISVSFYMTHYLIGASRSLAIGGSLACFTKPANTALFPCSSPLRMFRGRYVCVWPQKFDTDDVDMSGIWSTGTDWSTFIFSNSIFLSKCREISVGFFNF